MIHESLTTAKLLKLEDTGGIILDGKILMGLTKNDQLSSWYAIAPNVDRNLIAAWYTYYHAKTELESELSIIKSMIQS